MKLYERNLKLSESARNVWRVTPEDGVTLDDIIKEDFWGFVAKRFTRGDIIEVLSESGEWFTELLVRSCDRVSARVAVLRHVDLAAKPENIGAAEQNSEYTVSHKGASGWTVRRNSDNEVLAKKLGTREDAQKWLDQYLVHGVAEVA